MKTAVAALAISCSLCVLTFAAEAPVLQRVDAHADHFVEISRRIWGFAEVGYKEVKSSALLQEELRTAGFRVTAPVAEIPTAFTAEWGSGKPVIAILGEYDALPAMQQETVPNKRPLRASEPGHACGHNLFGAGSALACIALREWMVAEKIPGTIRFYGCPAEEGGSGKVFMVRAGLFADCDAALHWHPGDRNRTTLNTSLGNLTGKFHFTGRPAHAAGTPEKGRSALDGVMLFTHAIELLREHVPQTTRMHYVITKGGDAPNVVPAEAEVYFYLRSPEMTVIDEVWPRVLKCAEGAATATETIFNLQIVGSAYSLLPNDALTRRVEQHLRRVGGLRYTEEETAFARALQETLEAAGIAREKIPALSTVEEIAPVEEGISYGSTDVGDVSWAVPTAGFHTAAFVPGVPSHSWQSTACAGMSIGQKAMVNAARVLALTTVDLLTQPDLLAAARASFQKRTSGKAYRSRLPADAKPPLNYRDK